MDELLIVLWRYCARLGNSNHEGNYTFHNINNLLHIVVENYKQFNYILLDIYNILRGNDYTY